MKLEYFATLREVTKTREEEWPLPAPTLRVLMEAVVARYGPRFACWVMKDGELAGFAVILIDGRDVRHLKGLETPLSPDSTISIFPPVAGG